jgi:competence protein ComEA
MLDTTWTSTRARLSIALTLGFWLVAPTPGRGQATTPAKTQEKAKDAPKAKTKANAAATKLDLNKATAEEMVEALPGVGEATAAKIVAGRPYKAVEDLEKAGVPARTVEGLRGLVTFGPSDPPRPKTTAKTENAPEPRIARTTGKVDLNTANAARLQELPGVGESTAAAIIAGRPYKSVADLEKVKGLGEAKIAALRDLVTVGPAAATPTATAKVEAPAPKSLAKSKVETPKAATAPKGPVNLNTATKAQLEALPFIGPIKADAILKARPFKAKEDVMKVKGIKEGEFARIKDLIRVD